MLKEDIQKNFKGELFDSTDYLEKYSRDASLFKVVPKLVAIPQDKEDLKHLVRFVSENKGNDPTLSLTMRAGGTCMSGGAINNGIIVDTTKHFFNSHVDLENLNAEVEPGVYYREFELETLPEDVTLPVYPASKSLAALGGMINNNCGGEKTLRYGQIRNFINRLDMILSDGNEYSFKKLNQNELEQKIAQQDFEGEIYRRTYELISQNYDAIKAAKPQTSKNSAGYALWDIYDREAGTFDMTQLFTGAQGTLGVMTGANVRLEKVKQNKCMITLFFKDWKDLPEIVNLVLPHKPTSMEVFDDVTLKLGLKFMPEIAKKVGTSFWKFLWQFRPEILIGLKMLQLPKLVVLIELEEEDVEELFGKVQEIVSEINKKKIQHRVIFEEKEAEKYWVMRRESFNLLRTKVKGKQTAPFIDDICVQPEKLPKVLPEIVRILKENDINVNIAGHAGSGNLHIIPLMDLTNPTEKAKIVPVSEKIYDLVIENGGTITAEHNDGIIRTPFLRQMYGEKIYKLFEEIKQIFDPKNIFNPGKKVGGSKEYIKSHIVAK